MKTQAYAIYDSKARVFSLPFFSQNDEIAKRNFSALANDLTTQVGKFATDFSLFHIGTYDDESGLLDPCNHLNLGVASLYKNIDS